MLLNSFGFLCLVAAVILQCGLLVSSWESDRIAGFQSSKRKQGEVELEALLSEGEEKCVNKRCVHSDQCCPGSVCVDVDGVAGTCLPIYGVSEGESCSNDNDCEPGLRCLDNPPSPAALVLRAKTCQPPGRDMMKKQYNDECSTSSECDASRGLCCQLIKRHRMAPRKLCYYFADPKSCVGGPVDVTYARTVPAVDKIVNPNAFFKARIG